MQAHGSVITHLLSQVKIGMDLTKVCFILLFSARRIQETSAITQPAFTCSKLTIEILEQGVKYVQS